MDAEEVCKMRHEALEKNISQVSVALLACVRAEEIVHVKESLEQRIESLEEELDSLQTERAWMIRLVLGAVIVAVMSLVLISGPLDGTSL